MRAVVQRVSFATVAVDSEIVGSCGPGLLLLVGVHKMDCDEDAKKLAAKIANLRIFSDKDGKMNLSLAELPETDRARVIAVSNFTVYGDVSKSRRPSFTDSAGFEKGEQLYSAFVEHLRGHNMIVEEGIFGADMAVELENDGPVTLVIDVGPTGEAEPNS